MLTALLSLNEMGVFISGVSALLVALIAVAGWLDKRCKAHLDLTQAGILRAIGSRLRDQTKGVDPATYVTLDYQMDGASPLRIPLVHDQVTEPLVGFQMVLVDRGEHNGQSVYSITTIAHPEIIRLPWHYHDGTESITVVIGRMVDVATGHTYGPGDVWHIPPGTRHTADFFRCHAVCTMRPRLPLASDAPANLDAIERVYQAFGPPIA